MKIELVPLRPDHAEPLAAGLDETIWKLWPTRLRDRGDMEAHIETRLAEEDTEAFTVLADGDVAGSTTFYDIRARHRKRSIGWTFLLPTYRRTAVNTRVKLELLRRAFEDHDGLRVQFDIDARNQRSQDAVRRIGGVHEGTLRQHKICHDGFVRDTTIWSILRGEWPGVRERLHHLSSTS